MDIHMGTSKFKCIPTGMGGEIGDTHVYLLLLFILMFAVSANLPATSNMGIIQMIRQGLDTTTWMIKEKMPLQKQGMASMNMTSTAVTVDSSHSMGQ
jgi:hypothetical protein